MIASLRDRLHRLWRAEDGNATIEFAIVFPAIITIMLSGLELGFITLEHAMLERAMDLTARDIRLGTGTAPQHDDIKNMICGYAGFIPNCDTNLRLEMIQVDPRAWTDIDPTPDCTDKSEEVSPVRNFVNGQSNELMVLRACAKFDPVFPTTGLGKELVKDEFGQYSLTALTVFVQEPR
ncbi:TadE/TadG family type IV pilus assembly protein [Pseudodonghicola flavimaris]|uniref:TadE/TadG family type IV pilus assembly protein n=1 Tax=Pseudodonghicola flavimaris TaxID=3050036 RepID=A0ABT7F4E4_9RHOB|nr:TadE/TadG family type IV pilus assembly protein [Pseudodonghicola flavimaris]MDK3019477.1 TadE/TadG family type IV pilus assembly protein [Pseudodonghicola flavimaris]